MLTAAITTTATVAATSAITMTTAINIGIGGALVAVILVLLLSSRELITASTRRSKAMLSAMDALIVPLVLAFALSVAFQILSVISPLS